MTVHIVDPDQATKSGAKIGLCGAKVEGLYVKNRDGSRNSPSALCGKCVAASAQMNGAHPSKNDGRGHT
jgi:hypothetical protein